MEKTSPTRKIDASIACQAEANLKSTVFQSMPGWYTSIADDFFCVLRRDTFAGNRTDKESKHPTISLYLFVSRSPSLSIFTNPLSLSLSLLLFRCRFARLSSVFSLAHEPPLHKRQKHGDIVRLVARSSARTSLYFTISLLHFDNIDFHDFRGGVSEQEPRGMCERGRVTGRKRNGKRDSAHGCCRHPMSKACAGVFRLDALTER